MLTVRDHMTITLAATRFRYPAVRENRALDELGYKPTTFWARVDYLLDQPDALREHPQVVHRLRRLRDARARQRTARAS